MTQPMRERTGRRSDAWLRWVTPPVLAAVLAVTLALALAPKLLCLDQLAAGEPERHWCFSDLKALYDQRGFDVQAAPYAGPPPGYPVDYVFEYPPGIGLPAYGLARLVDTQLAFFLLNAATLLAAAAVSAWALYRALAATGRPRWRLLLFIASPGLVVFALHTWDLWSVAPVAVGLAAATNGRRRLAGALFGVGMAVKWWPALLVLLLVVGPWGRDRPAGSIGPTLRERLEPAAVAAAAWAAIQLPVLLVNPGNWWASMAVHFQRPPNPDGLYGVVGKLGRTLAPSPLWDLPYTRALTAVTFLALAGGAVYIAGRLERGTLDPADAALALVTLFLLTSKVVSPQFVLWLLPVAVLARLPWSRLLAVEIPNAAVWFALAGQVAHLGLDRPLAVLRAVALVWVLVTALRVRSPDEVTV